MAVVIQDNFNLAAAKAVDNRYGSLSGAGQTIPYTSTAEALSAIPSVYRHLGLTVLVTDGGVNKEYWFKNNTSTLVPKNGDVAGAKNGLTLDGVDGNVKLGGTLTENTVITLGVPFNTNSLNLYVSPTTSGSSPYPNPTTQESQKGVFSCFSPSKFHNNVSIGGLGVSDRYSSPSDVNKQPLYIYRADGILNSAVCVSTYSLYEAYGSNISNFSGTCSTVAAAFDQFEWSASVDVNLSTIGKSTATFAGNKSYFVYSSMYNTTNGNISANSAQTVLRARAINYTGVSSVGNTLTLQPSANPAADQVSTGDSIGVDSILTWPISVRVLLVLGNTITMEYYNGSSYVPYTPPSPLSGVTITIGRKGTVSASPNSIDNIINYRSMTPVPDIKLGYRGTLGKIVGLQIDDLRVGIGSTQNPSTERPKGTLSNSYGILQLGELDKNYLAGPLIVPKASSVNAGNRSMGTIQLNSTGSITINTTAARAANSMVFVSYMYVPNPANAGFIYVRDSDISNGSFILRSTNTADNNYVNWWIIANAQY
mgnify:CR=1 FL=1